MKKKIIIDISAHGYGHLAQCATVLTALKALEPDLETIVRCAHPEATIRRFLGAGVTITLPPPDPTLAMHGPDTVNVPETLRRYTEFLERLEDEIEADRRKLRVLEPALLLSNVGCIGLAAAAREGIRSVGLCSLNWADLLSAYDPEGMVGKLHAMRAAYREADLFIQPEPAMPMNFLGDLRRSVAPLWRPSRPRQSVLRDAAKAVGGAPRFVLISWGGIESDDDFAWLPRISGVWWIARGAVARADILDPDQIGVPFADLVASADVVVAKVGYGMFVEAAVAGSPVVHPERPDWPETPYLTSWLARHVPVLSTPHYRLRETLPELVAKALESGRGIGNVDNGAVAAAALVLGRPVLSRTGDH
jgi:hypothetical protein